MLGSRRKPAEPRRLIAIRPSDGQLVADATGRLLWGTAAGGLVWWVFDAAALSTPLLLAGLVAAAVATTGSFGVILAAVGSAVLLHGVDVPMRVAAAVAVVVTAAGVRGPARRLARRCGALPIDLLCVCVALGVLVGGPAGGFLAPVGAALVRMVTPARPSAEAARRRPNGRT
jgi:hypothetical protein